MAPVSLRMISDGGMYWEIPGLMIHFFQHLTDLINPFIGSRFDTLFSIFVIVLAVLISNKKHLIFHAKKPIAIFGFLLGCRYLLWRGFYTLPDFSDVNGAASITAGLALLLYLAEIFTFVGICLLYSRGMKSAVLHEDVSERVLSPSVDIFIRMKEQPLDDLFSTIIGCEAMEYPARKTRIFVLDEADRPEVKSLASRLHCEYRSLPLKDQNHEKLFDAAIRESSSELVMCLDGGDIPVSTFLMKGVTPFHDPTIAFVQVSIQSLTSDPFQQALFLKEDIPHEGELFYKVMEPGLDQSGTSVATKRGSIYRRTALKGVRGNKNGQPWSDLNLFFSACLHSKGWHSSYINQNLLLQTLTETPEDYIQKRAGRILEAGKGLLQGLPFWRHLSFGQRVGYSALLMSDLFVFSRMVFLLTPLLFFVGVPVVSASFPTLMTYAISFYLWQMIARYALAMRRRHPVWSAVYETADIAAIFIGIQGKIRNKNDHQRCLSVSVLPFVLFSGILVIGLGLGIFNYATTRVSGQGLFIGGVWTAYNLLLLTAAAASVRGRPHKRTFTRVFQETKCQFIAGKKRWTAMVANMSESGLSAISRHAVDLPEKVQVVLGDKEEFSFSGEVIRNEGYQSRRFMIGLRFHQIPEEERKKLIQWLYTSPLPWITGTLGHCNHRTALLALLTTAGRVFIDEFDQHRSGPRYTAKLPCLLTKNNHILFGTTIDASSTGVSIRVNEAPGPLTHEMTLEMNLSSDSVSVKAKPVWSRHIEDHWEIGLHLGRHDGEKFLRYFLPYARLKVISYQSFQARSLRFMGRFLAYSISFLVVSLVVGYFFKLGIIPLPTAPVMQTNFKFFWLSFFLILIDGVKVFMEILGRADPRQFHSDPSQVTALITCHNSEKEIEHTIEVLKRLLPDEQIIVLDDASTDNTAVLAGGMGVRVHSLKKNVGKSRAVTLGLAQVKTKYTLILDDDTRLQNLFLPTSLLEDGKTCVAFYVLPCRRSRERADGGDLVSCLQRYEYAKAMEIGRRFQDKSLSVSCISGAAGLFKTDHLKKIQALHSDIFPGEDLERTLIHLLKYGGETVFVNEPVWTVAPDSWKSLTHQRLIKWYPGFHRLFKYYVKILFKRKIPVRLRLEMFYNIYVWVSDPLKIISSIVLIVNGYWLGLAFLYLFYLSLEVYPFLIIEKKMPIRKYYLPALIVYPFFGLYNAFLRFGALFYWLWHRFVTGELKPRRRASVEK